MDDKHGFLIGLIFVLFIVYSVIMFRGTDFHHEWVNTLCLVLAMIIVLLFVIYICFHD